MSEQNRATLLIALWFLATLALIALFISAGAQGELSTGHIALAFSILALAIAGTPFVLRLSFGETEQGKTKRRRVNALLDDLSNEELIELKQRLAEVDSGDDALTATLGDDGEMVRRMKS